VYDLETSRICTPYIYDISHLRVNNVIYLITSHCIWQCLFGIVISVHGHEQGNVP
jgi:hypothetical protein